MKFYCIIAFWISLVIAGCASGPRLDIENIKSLAASGDSNAMWKLGAYYDGIAVNKKEAAMWYLKAAEAGNTEAQNSIGSMYQAGDGVEKDLKKAFNWFQKAAESEHPAAIHNLAYIYDTGAIGKPDKKKAIQLYSEAAKKGYIPSFLNLGIIYSQGDGVPTDKIEALKWLELGRFYTQHTYSPNSVEKKTKWLIRGHLDELKKRMTPQEISQGETLAETWSKNLKK